MATVSSLLRALAVVAPLVALAPDRAVAASRSYVLSKTATPLFVPVATTTDKDFYGHGPQTSIAVKLFFKNDREVWARVKMKAKETQNDWTTAEETKELLVATLAPGLVIDAIVSPTDATLGYTDKDHEEDYLVPGAGEVRPDHWAVPESNARPVRMMRVIGDTEGAEAGTRTGVQIFFRDIELSVHGTAATTSKQLAMNQTDTTTFPNGCASNAGWHVLAFYGKTITHAQFYKKVTSSSNFISDNNWGVPPGTLRDRLRDQGLDVDEHRQASKGAAVDTVIAQIDKGKPVIALTGWGGKAVRDVYAPVGDTVSWDFGASVLHYVVIRGYDRQLKHFYVLDNGRPRTWTWSYFQSVLFWQGEPHATAVFDTINVRNASLIY